MIGFLSGLACYYSSFPPRDGQGISAELSCLARLKAVIRGAGRPSGSSGDLIGIDGINDTLLDCRPPTDPLFQAARGSEDSVDCAMGLLRRGTGGVERESK